MENEPKLSRSDVKMVNQAKGLAEYLAVDVCIKIFGITIWEYHYPPKNS